MLRAVMATHRYMDLTDIEASFTRWKRPLANAQAGRPDIGSDLRRQAAEGYQWTPAGVHGGTNLDHGWDQMGPGLRPRCPAVR